MTGLQPRRTSWLSPAGSGEARTSCRAIGAVSPPDKPSVYIDGLGRAVQAMVSVNTIDQWN